MASDGSPAAIAGTGAVLSSQAADTAKFQPASGKAVPPGGNTAAAPAVAPSPATVASTTAAENAAPQGSNAGTPTTATASTASRATGTTSANGGTKSSQTKSTAASSSDPQTLVNQINKHLNDSGQADQFRLDPTSGKYIQQVNPANGAVVAQYSVSEFPALARSIGVSGLLIDDVA
jgi:hypothetical protein